MCLHCLGNFAQVRKVMMATTATMMILNAFAAIIGLMWESDKRASGMVNTARTIPFVETYIDVMVDTAVWITYLVYMSGVLNRLPNGQGYKVLGAELGRIALGAILFFIPFTTRKAPAFVALIDLIVFAYVFFVFKKSEVNDPQELLTACQGCPCTPLPISPPAQGQVVMGAPVMGAPVMGAPVMGAPVKGAPVMGDPVMGAPVMGAPVMGDPVMGAPVVGAPPVMGAPVVGAPVTGGPGASC